MTNDLRIADAPLLVDVSGEEKLPTGGYGNYSTTINQIADFTQLKWKLATEGYVNNEINVVTNKLNTHTQDKTNPHGVTKEQVGLGEVDNTADLDKPISVYQQSAIDEKIAKTNIVDNLTTNDSTKVLSAKQGKILQDAKANKTDVYSKEEVYTKTETLTVEREDRFVITESGRTQREKNSDSIALIDLNWKSDGTTDNTDKITALNSQMADSKAPILFNGTFKYTGQLLSLLPTTTLFRADKPTSMLLIDGTPSKPNTADDEPVEWVEKNTSRSFGTDTYAHNVGAVQGVVRQIGNNKTGTEKTSGVWTAGAFSAETISHNNGTDTAQDWDVNGSAIGLTATAKADGIIASGKIITGIWSEVTTPEVSDTVLDNSAGGSTCVGMEININVRHKDTGYGASKGTTRGIWMNHYPYKNTVEKNWTFGMCLTGGVVRDTDGADWSKRCGYRTGLYMDSIKNVGIEFGKYNNPNEAVGIKFPSLGQDRFKTAIQLNNNKINLGNFTGGTWDDGDLWYNSGAGTIYYRDNGENRAVYNTNFLIGGTSIRKKTADLTYDLGTSSNLFNKSFVTQRNYTATVFDSAGSGSPEGVLTAGVGSTYRRLDGGAGSSFYVKESGTGNTGWVAK